MAKLRTFVAIEIPQEVRHRSTQMVHAMAQATDSVRWVDTDNLHVTLKFLGDVEDRDIYSVCRAASNSVVSLEPFSVSCRGIDAFPSRGRPKTVWLGIDDDELKLTNLFARLDVELSNIGYPREPRKYIPHLTLGRIQHGRRNLGDLVAIMESLAERSAGNLPVESLTVFTSELHRSGPVYTVVGRAPLGA